MGRHIIDRTPLRDTGERLRQFLRIDRAAAPHPAALQLQTLPQKDTDDGRRLVQYLRIDRGRRA